MSYFDDDDDEEFGYRDDFEDDDYEQEGCRHCGPWCDDWVGDNLCQMELDLQRENDKAYHKDFYRETSCLICKKPLPEYDIKADELWMWPGDWFDPFIPLFEIYHAYGIKKGVLHSEGNRHHIFVGEGDLMEEKLIRLLGKVL